MGEFMGMMISQGYYTYDEVMAKRPDLREGVEKYLNEHGFSHLITRKEGA
ncbi:hypothetical protein PBC1_024 [Bacillus phage PBC1]|uniref:Uncharacterized protein n=1 Tax=Bacillus phage PBC1 TaxID=1161901 RepID=I1TLF8_9CAUD|nr:hypothetical protein PBC1_gp24 [Bacillus phage PBC1]AFE86260.1 hypothetical protein PBC1_024 [Bacillus phage PBC1]